ncbi:hypothetical protein DRO02_05960 [archaeon]|nr:MAG: hypothetical protein DRO02_05960 [archaeon]RLG64910.1 MAG: hypothetical protein DRN89_02270 [archaeon]HDM23367.1 ABC transporter substrate-binding protein [Candidatus Bathyarchaeota archaeon]
MLNEETTRYGIRFSKKMKILTAAVVLILIFVGTFVVLQLQQTPSAKVKELVIAGPPGPFTIPLAYIKEKGMLNDTVERVVIEIYENPAKLQVIVARGDADIIVLPTCTAALLYNKGFKVKFIGVCAWAMHYIVSDNPNVQCLHDIKGESIAIPFNGATPDALFSLLCQSEGLDPGKDFNLIHTASPKQAAEMILQGNVHHAILPEPLATLTILKTKAKVRKLYRVINISKAIEEKLGLKTPIAGATVSSRIENNSHLITRFLEAWEEAIVWVQENPAEAGKLAEKYLSQYGIKAKPMELAVKNIEWGFAPSWEAREDLTRYYEALLEACPNSIGGTLPDENFYYTPESSG